MNRNLTLKISLLLLTLFISSCATLSKKDCESGNWRQIGFRDGANGHFSNRFEEHQKACQSYNVQPNFEVYKSGYREGVRQHCRPENGYKLGYQEKSYNGVCPDNLRDAFLRKYVEGLYEAQREIQYKIDRKNNDFRELTNRLRKTKNTSDEIHKIQQNLDQLENEIRSLEERRNEIGRWIQQYR